MAPRHKSTPQVSLKGSWTVCKDFEHPNGNEDCFAWSPELQRAAVLDGATESFAAKKWVDIVAEDWIDKNKFELASAQAKYAEHISSLDMTWAQEQAASRGSFTTLASFEPIPGGLLATCIGDSAILLIKDSVALYGFPSMNASDYSSVPEALGSESELLSAGVELIHACTWTIPLEPGEIDSIILSTDAVAAWILTPDSGANHERIASLIGIAQVDQWRELVHQERSAGRMKADDSTFAYLTVEVPA